MENKGEYVTYKISADYIKGISDLKSEYAFHGNSQGDDSKTNSVDEFIGSGGWKSVSSNMKTNQRVLKQICILGLERL